MLYMQRLNYRLLFRIAYKSDRRAFADTPQSELAPSLSLSPLPQQHWTERNIKDIRGVCHIINRHFRHSSGHIRAINIFNTLS